MKNAFVFLILLASLNLYSASASALMKVKVVDCSGFSASSEVVNVEAFYSILTHKIVSFIVTPRSGDKYEREVPTWAVKDSIFTLESGDALLTVDGTKEETDKGWPSTLVYKGETTSNFFCIVKTS